MHVFVCHLGLRSGMLTALPQAKRFQPGAFVGDHRAERPAAVEQLNQPYQVVLTRWRCWHVQGVVNNEILIGAGLKGAIIFYPFINKNIAIFVDIAVDFILIKISGAYYHAR